MKLYVRIIDCLALLNWRHFLLIWYKREIELTKIEPDLQGVPHHCTHPLPPNPRSLRGQEPPRPPLDSPNRADSTISTRDGPPKKSQGRIQTRKQFQDYWAPDLLIQLLRIKVVKKLVMITGHEAPRCRNNLQPSTNPRPPGNREIEKTKASTELWDPLYQLL